MTTQTPPSPGYSPTGSGRPPNRSGATTPLMIALTIVGAVILAGVIVTTLFSAGIGLSRGSAATIIDTNGITSVEVEAGATTFDLAFEPVDEAVFETYGTNTGAWEVERNGDTLTVTGPDWWNGWCLFGCNNQINNTILTLPEELNDGSLSAYLELNSGSLTANGDFDVLDVEVNAGQAQVQGSATTLVANVSAGDADLMVENVDDATLDVSAGRLITELSGTAPNSTSVEVSAGQLILNVPDIAYAVSSEVSAGSFENDVSISSTSPHHIDVEVSAGSVILEPGAPTVP